MMLKTKLMLQSYHSLAEGASWKDIEQSVTEQNMKLDFILVKVNKLNDPPKLCIYPT